LRKSAEFSFLDPGDLTDGSLRLVLRETHLGDVAKDRAPEYVFGILHVETGDEVGTAVLRVGDAERELRYAGHLGYAIHEAHRGHRFAASTVRILLPLAKRHGLNPVWIACNAENIASRKIAQILGAELVEILPVPEDMDIYAEGERYACRYRLRH
jgi:tagatose 1,6-diphosphate aldolase